MEKLDTLKQFNNLREFEGCMFTTPRFIAQLNLCYPIEQVYEGLKLNGWWISNSTGCEYVSLKWLKKVMDDYEQTRTS